MKSVTILGATGSIGLQTLDVVARHKADYQVFALSANTNWQAMLRLCEQYKPRIAVMTCHDAAAALNRALAEKSLSSEVLVGEEGLASIVSHANCDVVVTGIVGAAGLKSALCAAQSGKRILLANKEPLVMAGEFFTRTAAQCGALILPVDSEHNAVSQCMRYAQDSSWQAQGIERIWLTASGGPFRHATAAQLKTVTPEHACAHPNWRMGKKISVDSATMMNKGLEIIEAHYLFGLPLERIGVVIHPQSVVHAMVEYKDGTLLTHMANPDMRVPIAQALAWPERITSGVSSVKLLSEGGKLEFEPVNAQQYPALQLAHAALRAQGTATSLLNAGNEVAVAAFLARQLRFVDIPCVIEHVLNNATSQPVHDLETILHADRMGRLLAQEKVAALSRKVHYA